MGRMDPAQRKRLISELTRLSRSEFEQVVDEVRVRPNTEELAVGAFRQAFAQRAADAPYGLSGLLDTAQEDKS